MGALSEASSQNIGDFKMKILTWNHIENILDPRLYGELSDNHVGVYVIYHQSNGKPVTLYVGEGNIKERIDYHRTQTDFGDIYPIYVFWAKTDWFDRFGIERYLFTELKPTISKKASDTKPISVNIPICV